MSKVNLNTLKKGEEIELRCGVKLRADSIGALGAYYRVHFGSEFLWYDKYGLRHETGEPSPLDIIAIHKKPFDWDTVEVGMAFRDIHGDVFNYLGPDWSDNRFAFFIDFGAGSLDIADVTQVPKDELTRAPKHDVKVSE